ncbi:general transcription factor IIH subunit 2-like [Corticium candelabrum]|uniref:general transcription factor IIH subunit 2-like n=1 Tax=Corticium candelabrum TaxID=121492 RepID=UPI002E260212|nr:general transcription factor IIH subunit 2-like [Corticium candelabrum]
MMDEDETSYRWETEYERSWENIQEDDSGTLKAIVADEGEKMRRRPPGGKKRIRLGMMRHLFLIVDLSNAMDQKDLRPSRLSCTLKVAENFILEFFDQNPISQLGVIVTRSSKAEKVTDLGGNPYHHVNKLKEVASCRGEPSLQNAMEMALQSLKHVPSHVCREIIIVMASLTTCDPGDILDTCESLVAHRIQCNIVGLAAEVHLCKRICERTKGQYGVILDERHFKELLMQHVTPPPALESAEASLIRMGFPHHHSTAPASYSMCQLDSSDAALGTVGYFCPQCKAKYLDLPVECKLCRLMLVSAPHLARSYHHFFPLPVFNEQHPTETWLCLACQSHVSSTAYECSECHQLFCPQCETFIHETLHMCPGCCSSLPSQTNDTVKS